jgi:hypothetical protein
MTFSKQVMDKAGELQKECHAVVDFLFAEEAKASGTSSLNYQDATNTWLFYKLAQMALRIEELELNNMQIGE